jgi:hypothetical protein
MGLRDRSGFSRRELDPHPRRKPQRAHQPLPAWAMGPLCTTEPLERNEMGGLVADDLLAQQLREREHGGRDAHEAALRIAAPQRSMQPPAHDQREALRQLRLAPGVGAASEGGSGEREESRVCGGGVAGHGEERSAARASRAPSRPRTSGASISSVSSSTNAMKPRRAGAMDCGPGGTRR